MTSIRYRLGLDVGSTSLGWWIWEEDVTGEVIRSVDGGVCIYSDSREPKTGTSKATARRVARGIRRRRDRYLKRRDRLMNQLVEFGLMPSNSSKRKELESLDPYKLRVRALDEQLQPFELGRALFHLNQRRGFKSNRVVDSATEQTEQGSIRSGISTLDKVLMDRKYRTIGEYLLSDHKSKKSVRFRPGVESYPSRKHYQDEFNFIRRIQEPLQHLPSEHWDALEQTIFFQRRLRPIEPGKCTLFPDENRAPWALPIAQQFRVFQEINSLQVIQIGERDRRLSTEERERAFHILSTQTKVRFESLRKKLNLRLDSRFNLEGETRNHLDGDKTAAILRKKENFGKSWDQLDLLEQTRTVKILLTRQREDEVIRILQEEQKLSKASARAISTLRLPKGYGNLSEYAMEAIVPHLKQGLLYHEAVTAAFPDRDHSQVDEHKKVDLLPYYPVLLDRHVSRGSNDPNDDLFKKLGKIANPTVHVGLNRIRRVVNAIVMQYGPPAKIAVELARDLKNSFEEKQKIKRRQAEERNKNERRREDLENCGRNPNPEYLRKIRLWEEQGPCHARCCPYCGRILSYEMVLDDRTQIDHILPFSRTLDDGLSNKVVCCNSCNQIKRNKTPFEAFGFSENDKFDYDKMLYRISSNWPKNKKWRFYPDAMARYEDEECGFLARQLNDTRYLSRITKTYLQFLCDSPTQVSVTPGHLTALIRGKWGLNFVLADSNYKDRTDHRHHAIDAAVISLIDRSMLQRVSSAAAAGVNVNRFLPNMPEPTKCRNFRDQIKDHALNHIFVVHRPRHVNTRQSANTTSGQLHNDTAFGIVNSSDSNVSFVGVRRLLLSDLNEAEGRKLLLGKAGPGERIRKTVRDESLRRQLLKVWLSFSERKQSWREFCEYVAKPGRVTKYGVRKLRYTEHKDSLIKIRDINGRVYKGFKPASNARMDIIRLPNGKYKGQCVSTFDANQERLEPERSRNHPEVKCVSHLFQNDLIAIGAGNNREILRVVKLAKSGRVCATHHYEGGKLDARDKDVNDPFKYIDMTAQRFVEAGLRKIKIDPIGKIYDPGPIITRA